MKRVGLAVALAACAAVEAAEPVAAVPPVKGTPTFVVAPAATNPKPVIRRPLDLRIGDVRKYMMPNEFRDVIGAPDADANTVVVEGKREQVPMKFEQPVPGGIIAPFWALAHPLQSWRVFVPDLNRGPEGPREPADKVPPPIFRWGP